MEYDKELKYEIDSNGCWIWTGAKNQYGYGILTHNYKNYRAHRFAWLQAGLPLADEQVLMHECDNRACINVEHLRAGTQQENIDDMRAKHRGADQTKPIECKNGHTLNHTNSYRFNNRTVCRICKATSRIDRDTGKEY